MEISCQSFFLNNYCGYFIEEIRSGFLCLDTLIHSLGMLLDFQKVFYAFLKSRNILRVWIKVSKHGKPLGISLVYISVTNLDSKELRR